MPVLVASPEYIPPTGQDDEEVEDSEIHAFESVPSDLTGEVSPTGEYGFDGGPIRAFNEGSAVACEGEEHGELVYSREPTMSLDLESLEVPDIRSLTYDSDRLAVKRQMIDPAHR